MKEWWNRISTREQAIVAVAGLIALVVILDGLLLTPYRLHSQQLDEQISQAREDLGWMQQQVHRLPKQSQQGIRQISGRLVTFIDSQIVRAGLKQSMQQMTPIQDDAVRLRLADVEFNQLLRFFSSLDGLVRIDEARILPTDQPGQVGVSLVVRKKAAEE
ncbi:MAG: type II secretion system protein GspM [Gammaproteobacteria bacterium]|nr:type II secretion system protein GspM [Gammaproteobacteria bacterium]